MFYYGMYVKCVVYNDKGESLELVAQIDRFIGDKIVAFAYEWNSSNQLVMRRFTIDAEDVEHLRLSRNSKVLIKGKSSEIIEWSNKRTNKGHYTYYCRQDGKIRLVSEEHIQAAYTDYVVPVEKLFNKTNISSISDYLVRNDILEFMNRVEYITEGYNDALCQKIDMYEHQIDTVQRVIENRPYRAILADEVGLGKTVEALVILTYALKKGVCKSVLIVVPDQLVFQWRTEAKTRFNLDVKIFSEREYIYKKITSPVVIIGFSNYARCYSEYLKYKEWNLVIFDEVHKALQNRRLYNAILGMCKKTGNVLLLSATPIMQENEDYYKLLKLLQPNIYGKITVDEFSIIMEKKKSIEEKVSSLFDDIRFSFEDEDLPGYLDRIITISEEVQDYKLKEILGNVNEGTEDEKREKINLSLLYLQKTYELESKFIRHRRADILDESSKRKLYEHRGFYYRGEDKLSNEMNIYECLKDELENLRENQVSSEKKIEIISAFLSSTSALLDVLEKNNLIEVFPNTFKYVYKEAQNEKSNLSSSRLDELIAVLKEGKYDGKVAIFSEYYKSVELIYKRIAKEFGKDTVNMFTESDTEAGMQIAANAFRNNVGLKFLVCDSAGAEGQNLQFADYIIHYDMPWSPARMEQRIGRLDRIGRKPGKPVNNIVLYVKDTVEEDLFSLYRDCLNIFDESLCGIEIIFDDLWKIIKGTIEERGLLGFTYVFDPICELKEKCEQVLFDENINQICMEADEVTSKNVHNTVIQFSNDEKCKFLRAICKWHTLSGYQEVREDKNGVFLINNKIIDGEVAKKRQYKAVVQEEFKATNILEVAINNDDVELLTIKSGFIENVINNVRESNYGKISAVRMRNCAYSWKGFLITWKAEFREIDNMGQSWSRVNVGLKNEFIQNSRITIPYIIYGPEVLASEIFDMLNEKENSLDILTMDQIEDSVDFTDINKHLQEAINHSKKEFYELIQNDINYSALEKKIKGLKDEDRVYGYMNRENKEVKKFINVYEGIYRMLKKMEMSVENILFVDIMESEK